VSDISYDNGGDAAGRGPSPVFLAAARDLLQPHLARVGTRLRLILPAILVALIAARHRGGR